MLDEPRADAPLGYGEHAEAVALHERLLTCFGRVWHGPDGAAPLPQGWEDWPEKVRTRNTIGNIIDREVLPRGIWVVKDPRLSRLLPLWLGLLDERGITAETVLCVRHPGAVAASLAQRNGMAEEQALGAWQAHVDDALGALGTRRSHIVAYDDLLTSPRKILTKLLKTLGVKAEGADIGSACALALTPHRHHLAPAFGEGATSWQIAAQKRYDRLLNGRGNATAADGAARPTSRRSVAIVLRTRDRQPFLPRALRSILAQTHPGWHLTIVNDGGDPAPVETAIAPYRSALGDRLTVFHLPGSIGMEAASNHAIAAASQDVVAIHDDDGSWQPRFLETCLARMEATGMRGVATASVVIQERSAGHDVTVVSSSRFLPETTGIHYHELLVGNRFPPIAFVYDRNVVAEIGPYRSDLPVLGDWNFNLRFAARYPIAFVTEPLANWHRRPADDAFPNSRLSEHERVTNLLRDEQLRDAGHGAVAAVSAILPVVQASLQATAAHRPVLDGIEAGLAALLDRANRGDTAQPRALTPRSWALIERQGESWISLGNDPQIRLEPLQPPLSSGHWRFSVELSVSPGNSRVQLFFSKEETYTEAQSIFLRQEGPGRFGGVMRLRGPVRHLRLDPMAGPGQFRLGAMSVVGADRGFPDFLCIGAQRSGTTWLHRNLAARHDVWLPPAKEVHFFDTMFGADGPRWARDRLRFLADCQNEVLHGATVLPTNDPAWRKLEWAARFATSRTIDADWYENLFREAPSGAIRGDISPGDAVLSEEGVAYAARLMPDMKVLFLMRDPVERAVSGALHELTTAAGTLAAPSGAALEAALRDPRCVARSAYRETIERWERHVAPERMTYLFFDEVRVAPLAVLRRVCEALDLPYANGLFPLAAQPQNANPLFVDTIARSEDRSLLASRYGDELDWLADCFGGHAKEWASRARRLASRSTHRRPPGEPPIEPTLANVTHAMRRVVEEHGPWASHNVELAEGLFTIGERPTGDALRPRRFLAVTEALLRGTVKERRVLDLACGEGLYALEYARRGGQVVAVEIRDANLARASGAMGAGSAESRDRAGRCTEHIGRGLRRTTWPARPPAPSSKSSPAPSSPRFTAPAPQTQKRRPGPAPTQIRLTRVMGCPSATPHLRHENHPGDGVRAHCMRCSAHNLCPSGSRRYAK